MAWNKYDYEMFKQAKAIPKYYLYKILVRGSTLSYIGVTKDFKRRSKDHYMAIRSIINGIRSKNKNIVYYSTAHLTIAHFLYKNHNRKGYVSYMHGLTISVIQEYKCPIKAKESETEHIARYSKWGKNLNISKKSAYNITPKDPSKPKRKPQPNRTKTISHYKIKKSCLHSNGQKNSRK